MSNESSPNPADSQRNEPTTEREDEDPFADLSSSSSDSDSDSDSDFDSEPRSEHDPDRVEGAEKKEDDIVLAYTRPRDQPLEPQNVTPEENIKQFSEVLESRRVKTREEEEDRNYKFEDDIWNFPIDPENWTEEDLGELWGDAPIGSTKPGWDPAWADEEDWELVQEELKSGGDPPYAPFYIPYRKPYPPIPDTNFDVSNPKSVIEELDRIEEFLTWVSYIFPDGSTYEGTVWDDLAHGKGVYVAENGLVRYEGEWLQNDMEGHGVVEVEIPGIEPVPGSKLEAKMRAEGKIIARDFMSPEDKEWLEMDIEDSIRLAGGEYEIPFYENQEWIRQFGKKPEKGRYRYAGEWKHGRMHGCGVYEVNERTLYGRFYFGEFLEDDGACDEDISAMHAGIAEVAAAKARMFVNKPDGMVREERGPYGDPQHPYLYEEEDTWMAPGFINQFYEVPDYWKTYVDEVDKEREMWLNSFYKAPLRLPMPAELEHWWSNDGDEIPEFVLINKEPEPDPEDPSKLVYTEDPVILHTPTGRIINYVEDEKYGVRLFWQPPLKDGEDVDPTKVEFLPLGYDEFFGREVKVKKENIWQRLIMAVENACKPVLEKLEKWTEEKKKASEMKIQEMEKELGLIEAELRLEEAIDDLEDELEMQEKEEAKKLDDLQVEDVLEVSKQEEEASVKEEQEEEEDDEEEEDEGYDDSTPSSFGFVSADNEVNEKDKNGNKPGGPPFSALSMSFTSCTLAAVPSMLQKSFLSWKGSKPKVKSAPSCCQIVSEPRSVTFTQRPCQKLKLKAARREHPRLRASTCSGGRTSHFYSLASILMSSSASEKPKKTKYARKEGQLCLQESPEADLGSILSLHTPLWMERLTDANSVELHTHV